MAGGFSRGFDSGFDPTYVSSSISLHTRGRADDGCLPHNDDIVFYHPLDDKREYTQDQDWIGAASFVPGVVGNADSAALPYSLSVGSGNIMPDLTSPSVPDSMFWSPGALTQIGESGLAAIMFEDSDGDFYRFMSVSGETITMVESGLDFRTPFAVNGYHNIWSRILPLDSEQLVATRDFNNDELKLRIGTVSGSEIVWATSNNAGNQIGTQAGALSANVGLLDVLDDKRFIASYTTANPREVGVSIGQAVGSGAEATISHGDTLAVTPNELYHVDGLGGVVAGAMITPNRGVLVYNTYYSTALDGEDVFLRAVPFTVDGLTITSGVHQIIATDHQIVNRSSAYLARDLFITILTEDTFVVAYTLGADIGGDATEVPNTVVGCTIDGDDTITPVDYVRYSQGVDGTRTVKLAKIGTQYQRGTAFIATVSSSQDTTKPTEIEIDHFDGNLITRGPSVQVSADSRKSQQYSAPSPTGPLGSPTTRYNDDFGVVVSDEKPVELKTFTWDLGTFIYSPTPGVYPSANGAERWTVSMWLRNPTVDEGEVIVKCGYDVTVNSSGISLDEDGSSPIRWAIDVSGLLDDGNRHSLVLDFENQGGGAPTEWDLNTSIDGAAWVGRGTQTGVDVTDDDGTPTLIYSSSGITSNQWVDELAVWKDTPIFTGPELQAIYDLADLDGAPLTSTCELAIIPINSDASLYTQGHDILDDGTDLFVGGLDTSISSITMYLKTDAVRVTSGVDLFVHGLLPISSGISLFLKNSDATPISSGISLFTKGVADIPGSIDLFLNGHEYVNCSSISQSTASVYGVGGNLWDKMGPIGQNVSGLTQIPLQGSGTITDFSHGGAHSFYLLDDGGIISAGSNSDLIFSSGYCGQGNADVSNTFGYVQDGTGDFNDAVQISCGNIHNVVLDSSGSIWVGGSNVNGELGIGNPTSNSELVLREASLFAPVLSGVTFTKVLAGYFSSFALADDGSVYVCGLDFGHFGFSANPGAPFYDVYNTWVKSPLESVSDISIGFRTLFITDSTGSVSGLGQNFHGELGAGSITSPPNFSEDTPVAVGGIPGGLQISEIAGGGHFTLFLMDNGDVYSVGLNTNGQLGLGDTTARTELTKVAGVSGVTDIDALIRSSYFLQDDEDILSCGVNDKGQLGIGTVGGQSNSPVSMINVPPNPQFSSIESNWMSYGDGFGVMAVATSGEDFCPTLFEHGHESISSGISLSIKAGEDSASGIDLFIRGPETVSGTIDVFIHGMEYTSASITLVLKEPSFRNDDITLFIDGPVYVSGAIDLSIHGVLPIASGIDLTVDGHEVSVSGISLFVAAIAGVSSGIPLVIEGSDLLPNAVYWTETNADRVYTSDIDLTNTAAISSTFGNPIGIAIHQTSGYVFWTNLDITDRKIIRSESDGFNRQVVVTAPAGDGIAFPLDIDVDENADKIYWTDFTEDNIGRADLDGTNQEIVVSGITSPVGIFVDVVNSKLYWIEDNAIKRSNLDGSSSGLVATISLGAKYLTADISNNALFWTNSVEDVIYTVSTNGGTPSGIITSAASPMGIELDVSRSKLYWCDQGTGSVMRADTDGSNIETLEAGFPIPWGIDLNNPLVEPLAADESDWSVEELLYTNDHNPHLVGNIGSTGSFGDVTIEVWNLNQTTVVLETLTDDDCYPIGSTGRWAWSTANLDFKTLPNMHPMYHYRMTHTDSSTFDGQFFLNHTESSAHPSSDEEFLVNP